MIALGDLLRHEFRVHVFDQPTALGGEKFAKGTLAAQNGREPRWRFTRPCAASPSSTDCLCVQPTPGWSMRVRAWGVSTVSWVKPPKVAMLVDRPASPYAGHTWYLFDQVWHYPLTRVPGSAFSTLDLSKYNVLILPDGRYPGPLGEPFVARLKDWVRRRRHADPCQRSRRMGHREIGLACSPASR